MQPGEYAQMFRLEDSHWWFQARRSLLCRALSGVLAARPADAPPPLLLDVGCGTGGTIDRLREFGQVVGVDVEPMALDFCRSRGHTRLVRASATFLPFADNTFDALVALDVLEHIEHEAEAVREMVRVLRPGGSLFLTVPAYPALWSGHDVALMHHRRYVSPEIAALLQTGGLQIIHQTYTVSVLLPLVWAWRTTQKILRPRALPRADVAPTGRVVNSLLFRLLEAESRVALRTPLPFGLTIFAIARKP